MKQPTLAGTANHWRRGKEGGGKKIIYCRYRIIGHDALDDIFVSH